MRFNKALWLVLWFVLLSVAAGRAESPDGEEKVYEYRIRNLEEADEENSSRRMFKVREFSCRTEPARLSGDRVMVFHRQEKTGNGDRINWKFYFDPQKKSLIRREKKIISGSGRVLEQSTEFYRESFYDYPRPNAHINQAPILGSFLDLETHQLQKVWMIFSVEFSPIFITAEVKGTETIKVPAGEFDCYKVEIKYNPNAIPLFQLLPDYIASKLLPSYQLWVGKNPPHPMVRFQGKLEGMTSPEQAQELFKIHD